MWARSRAGLANATNLRRAILGGLLSALCARASGRNERDGTRTEIGHQPEVPLGAQAAVWVTQTKTKKRLIAPLRVENRNTLVQIRNTPACF